MAYGDSRTSVATDSLGDIGSSDWQNGEDEWATFEQITSAVECTADNTDTGARRDTETFDDDQFCIITIQAAHATGDSGLAPWVRGQGGAGDASCYLGLSNDWNSEYELQETNTDLSTFTNLASTGTGWAGLSSGDTLTIEAEGTTLRLGDDRGTDTQRLTTTDNTLTSGNPGMHMWEGIEIEDTQISAWEAGDIGGAVTRTASGTPILPALTGAGTSKVRRLANGTPSIPALTAVGASTVHRLASGTPSIPALTATGSALIPFVCDEKLAPDTLVEQLFLAGAVTDIDEDPDAPDANWLTLSAP
jgi:hypothetical protein